MNVSLRAEDSEAQMQTVKGAQINKLDGVFNFQNQNLN